MYTISAVCFILSLFLSVTAVLNTGKNVARGNAAAVTGVFKIPELVIHTNSSYLTRNAETRLECRIAGQPVEWASATLEHVLWLRDGASIDTTGADAGDVNFVLENTNAQTASNVLRVLRTGHHSEGEFQCSAIVRHVSLSPVRTVDTRLVSAPLKLRRARITKFERYEPPVIRVRQGQVARLPCYGLPDVIPGPPEIWFEKMGHEGLALGKTGNERFIVTASGLQIALSQPTDAGRYFCVVRNVFTNQTRRAPRPVNLVVDLQEFSDNSDQPAIATPRIIFPEFTNYSEPIDFHVVVGQSVILECVVWDAKVVWNRTDYSMAAISLTDDRARIRQIWGNLRIKQVKLEDAGEYVCRGLPLFEPSSSELTTGTRIQAHNPQIVYRLIVHAPTNVRLMLAQSLNDKSWQLSCYAHNLHYEIPMVYVNGLALIDAMEEMGVPPHTNFFTNPINITLGASSPLAGSVQCISRPAMEEAEIYGVGLERGRSMNLFVDEHLNAHSDISPHASTNGNVQPRHFERADSAAADDSLVIQRPLAFVAGDNSVRIQWRVQQDDESKRIRIQYFLIEILKHDTTLTTAVTRNEGDTAYAESDYVENDGDDETETRSVSPGNDWQLLERVPSHVRALTLRRIIAAVNNEFQLRVTAVLESSRRVSSPPTDRLRILKAQLLKNNASTAAPLQPIITRLQAMSPHTILVEWNYSAANAPLKYVVSFEPFEVNYHKMHRQKTIESGGEITNNEDNESLVRESDDERSEEGWNGWMQRSVEISAQKTRHDLLLTDLNANTEYKVTVVAVNSAGRSLPSSPRIARTYIAFDETQRSDSWLTKLRRDYLNLPDMNVKLELIIGVFIFAIVLLILLCCLAISRLREWSLHVPLSRHRGGPPHGSSVGSANQFFLESSSPTRFSASSPTNGCVLRPRKNDRGSLEQQFPGGKYQIPGELSPLSGYNNVYRRDEKDFSLQLSLQNDKCVKSSLVRNDDHIDDNSSDVVRYVSRRIFAKDIYKEGDGKETDSSQLQKPNLYGNPNATLDEAMEDIYGHNQSAHCDLSPALLQNATISRGGTLMRMPSTLRKAYAPLMDGARMISPTSGSHGHYASSLALNRPSSELRFASAVGNSGRKSPTPSALSTSMYSGAFAHISKTLMRPVSANKSMHDGDVEPQRCNLLGLKMACNGISSNNSNNDSIHEINSTKDLIPDDASDVIFPNGMPALNRLPYLDSIYSSRLSLYNCGNGNVVYGDALDGMRAAFRGDDSGHYSCKNSASTPTADTQPSLLGILPSSSTSGGNQLSTFKSSPAPSSCGGSSSGYNSSYCGNGFCLISQTEPTNTVQSNQSPLIPTKFHDGNVIALNNVKKDRQNESTSSNYSTFERRTKHPTLAVVPTFFSKDIPESNNNVIKPCIDSCYGESRSQTVLS